MTASPKELACLSGALRLLQEARTLQEVISCANEADEIARFRQQADCGHDVINEASIIRLYAERRLGELLRETPLAKAAPGNQYTSELDRSPTATGPVYLRDIGITKSRSSRAQKLAELPQDAFDNYVSDKVMAGQHPTIAGALKLQKQHESVQPASSAKDPPSGIVTSLQSLLDEGRTFVTIVADPPWPHSNRASGGSASNHCPTMSVQEICDEPVAELAAKDSHLHLWATSPLLPRALTVMEAWGFEYKSSFVWVKPQAGTGNFWRVSHELLLLGVRGNLSFVDRAQRSWLEADRTKQGAKPQEVRPLIEKVSPGPYLEMYGREQPINSQWTVYGNQLNGD